jgi:hypothetical protein
MKGGYPAQKVCLQNWWILVLYRIAPGDPGNGPPVTRDCDYTVNDEVSRLHEADDVAHADLGRSAVLDGQNVARPERGKHACAQGADVEGRAIAQNFSSKPQFHAGEVRP